MSKVKLTGRRAVGSAAAVIAAGGLVAVGGAASPAFAAPSPPSLSHGQETVTFTAATAGQTFTVPYGVSSLYVRLAGASGGAHDSAGATVSAALAVTGGEKLTVDTGHAGTATDVKLSSTQLLVAAGGSGGKSYTGGAGVSNARVSNAANPGNGAASFSYADPVHVGGASYTTTEGKQLTVSASGLLPAKGPAGQVLTASAPSATTARGGSVTVSANGGFTYTPRAGFAGSDSFRYTVTDQYGDTTTGTAVITVAAAPVFHASNPALRVYQGAEYSYQFAATGFPAPRYALSSAPGWLSVNARTGLVTGRVPLGTRSFSYSVTATNAAGTARTRTFYVNVLKLPQAIHFTTPATGVVGKSVTLTATGGRSGNPVTFAVDPSSGRGVVQLSGNTVKFLRPGTAVIDAYQGGNAVFGPASARTTILVGTVPKFTHATPAKTTATGRVYSYRFTAAGSPAPRFVLIGAPKWLHVNSQTGQVSGVVPRGTKSFSYQVAAVNAVGKATTGTFTVTVK